MPKAYPKRPARKKYYRAPFHNYKEKGYYLITATAMDTTIPFSSMPATDIEQLKRKEMILPIHSLLGDKIKEELQKIPLYHPRLEIKRFVIMPDHIHFIVRVKERLNKHLGNELTGFFGACSTHYSILKNLKHIETLFHPYHDSILFTAEQLDKAYHYIEDNPRRLIIKRMYPELFKAHQNLKIAGYEFSAFGNMFLLRKPWLLSVRIHRRWSEKEMKEYVNKCTIYIENGAIPISPAIHPTEKRILQMAVDMGSPIIKLRDKAFGERFKPYGKEFDLCAEGRLLLLAPKFENLPSLQKAGYREFHDMNDMALAISKLSPESRCSISIAKKK